MVRRDVIRKERLDIHCNPAARFQHTFALSPDCKELCKIFIPFMRVITGVLCIGMAEVIGGRCNDQIDTLGRDP